MFALTQLKRIVGVLGLGLFLSATAAAWQDDCSELLGGNCQANATQTERPTSETPVAGKPAAKKPVGSPKAPAVEPTVGPLLGALMPRKEPHGSGDEKPFDQQPITRSPSIREPGPLTYLQSRENITKEPLTPEPQAVASQIGRGYDSPPMRQIRIAINPAAMETPRVDAVFRSVERSAEIACSTVLTGFPKSHPEWLRCIGAEVEYRVFNSRDPELVRYFQTLIN